MKMIPPTIQHLSRAYYELGRIGARSVGEKRAWPYRFKGREELLTLAAELSRWDPRLLEILVQYGKEHWQHFSPQKLRHGMKKMEAPQTIGVIAAFIRTANPKDKECRLFWDYVTDGLVPVETQFYFRDLYAPAGRSAERAARESLAEFKQWGFLGKARIVIDPVTKKTIGTWDQTSRLNILRRLLQERKKLRISEYLAEIDFSISRQQALLDLKFSKAKPEGEGRSACWTL